MMAEHRIHGPSTAFHEFTCFLRQGLMPSARGWSLYPVDGHDFGRMVSILGGSTWISQGSMTSLCILLKSIDFHHGRARIRMDDGGCGRIYGDDHGS
jgi:hypothetical protein